VYQRSSKAYKPYIPPDDADDTDDYVNIDWITFSMDYDDI